MLFFVCQALAELAVLYPGKKWSLPQNRPSRGPDTNEIMGSKRCFLYLCRPLC